MWTPVERDMETPNNYWLGGSVDESWRALRFLSVPHLYDRCS